jgi:hypothetical protein
VRSHPKGIKPKMRERKLRSDGSWKEALKQKGLNQKLGVF